MAACFDDNKGEQAECDAQVKAACKRAAFRLNQQEW